MTREPCINCKGSMEGRPPAARYCSNKCKNQVKARRRKEAGLVEVVPKAPKPVDPYFLVRGKISNLSMRTNLEQ